MAKRTSLPTRYEVGFIRELDRRTDLYQRLNAAYEAVVEDVGGADGRGLSHAKLALVERFVFLEEVLQTWERQIVLSPETSADLMGRWIQGMNSLQGLARAIGLEREMKQVVDLKSYVRGKDL